MPAVLPPLPKDAPARPARRSPAGSSSPENPLDGPGDGEPRTGRRSSAGASSARREDFGFQGEPPTHPELLDWLAVEFVERGWSMKALHRLIVTQRDVPAVVAGDARSCWRRTRRTSCSPAARGSGWRRRWSATRRCAASGLLSPKVGGPSVFPPQPAGVTTEGAYGALDWKAERGRGPLPPRAVHVQPSGRRRIAMFGTFDGPSGEVVRRPARGVEHAAAGADAAQRRGLRRGGAGARPAAGRGAGDGRGEGRRRCSAAASSRPPTADELATARRGSTRRSGGGSSEKDARRRRRSPGPATGDAGRAGRVDGRWRGRC